MKKIKKMKHVIHDYSRKLIVRLLLLALIPSFFLSLANYFINHSYITASREEVIEDYRESVISLSHEIHQLFAEIRRTNDLLYINQDFIDFLTSNSSDFLNQPAKILNNYNSILQLRSTKDIIDNIFIYNRQIDYIISTLGTSSGTAFFTNNYVYEKYTDEYWKNLSIRGQQFLILPPSDTALSPDYINFHSSVIPVVQATINSIHSKNFLVANINTQKLQDILTQKALLHNSVLFITDASGTLYSHTEKNGSSDEELEEIYHLKNYCKLDSGIYYDTINHKENAIIVQKLSILSNDFVFTAFVPVKEMKVPLNYNYLINVMISITALLLSLSLSVIFAKRIYSPVDHLLVSMKANNAEAQIVSNDLMYIRDSYQDTVSKFNMLSTKLDQLLPLAMDQTFLKALNNSTFVADEQFTEHIQKAPLNFCHPYYCVSVVNPNFTKKFYQTYDNDEQICIFNGLCSLLSLYLPENIHTHTLSTGFNQIYLIANVPDQTSLASIEQALQRFYDVFIFDLDYHQMCIGIGQIQDSIEYLHISCRQARQASAMVSSIRGSQHIRMYQDTADMPSYIYTPQDDNLLFNYLISGTKDRVTALSETIIQTNLNSGIPEPCMKELCFQLYQTGLRVLKAKNTTPEELMGMDYINFIAEYPSMSLLHTSQYISDFLNKISEFTAASKERSINIEEIKQYIAEHYADDIYLEQLSDHYKISAAYLSRCIKKELGITFTDYLAQIRIAKAKELLVHTKTNVNDIAELVGFNSRNTFIRMFKKLEGVTPSVYRNSLSE